MSEDPKWSFVKKDDQNFVSEVAEKKQISYEATSGVYIWSEGQKFVHSAEKMIDKNIRVNNEFYLAPTFNEMIIAGDKIVTYPTRQMIGLGTPAEYEHYIQKGA